MIIQLWTGRRTAPDLFLPVESPPIQPNGTSGYGRRPFPPSAMPCMPKEVKTPRKTVLETRWPGDTQYYGECAQYDLQRISIPEWRRKGKALRQICNESPIGLQGHESSRSLAANSQSKSHDWRGPPKEVPIPGPGRFISAAGKLTRPALAAPYMTRRRATTATRAL
jgi:hypothetical protein